MFKPISLFIGLRYTRAKRRNHFISLISLVSMFGIALGVLVLITVLSVMNGFDKEIKKRVFGMVPAITVTTYAGFLNNWQAVQTAISHHSSVTAVAPFVSNQVLITNEGLSQPSLVTGILPNEERKISALMEKMITGNIHDLTTQRFMIVLGEELANRLDAKVGDKVTLFTPASSLSPAGVTFRSKRFTVAGTFRAGSGFGFDTTLAFIHLKDAQALFEMGPTVTGLHVGLQNVYMAPKIADEFAMQLGPPARVLNWSDQFGAFFHAVNLEKKMMFLILLLIIAVAVFNLVCTLVMVVSEKSADIAILRTVGATPRMIMMIFIVQGAIIGIVGTLLGVIGGITLALNVTSLVSWIEHIFHIHFLSASVNFVDYLPSELEWGDVWRISVAALSFSLVATLYPAWNASRTEPVEALRYE